MYLGHDYVYAQTMPEGHRVVKETGVTQCTFGYAVSRQGVRKVLSAFDNVDANGYDTALSWISGDTSRLKCYAVLPEVMHHYVAPEEDGISSDVSLETAGIESSPGSSLGDHMGTTGIVVNSTRCHVLFDSTCFGNS